MDCARFLEWALPRMGLRPAGFRRVRRQVCRRVSARVQELELADLRAYAAYLERTPAEWETLEALCGVTISRFYRDRRVFDVLAERVLPERARAAGGHGTLRAWSAGCASGEEPYTLALIWQLRLAAEFPGIELRVLATDRDPQLLARAERARYRRSSVRELPPEWVERAFVAKDDELELAPALRKPVVFERQDLRRTLPQGPFDVILCRNLAFSYFDEREQQRLLGEIATRLVPSGYLVIGAHERLPGECAEFEPLAECRSIYRLRA